MAEKPIKNQMPERRKPQQERSRHKIGLILEAAMRLLESGGMDALTTNAVAAMAGVSIGTLYQYFHDKQAILDALVERELGDMSEKVMMALQAPTPDVPGARIRTVVQAVMSAYGGRNRVHRMLMAYRLSRGSDSRMQPLHLRVAELFASEGIAVPGRGVQKMTRAEAFVLAHAFAGVMRGMVANDTLPKRQEIEDALVRLVTRYVGIDMS
jgi:AcrR family transcriptional regulator